MRIESPRGKLPVESLHVLDWLNFFLAALLTTFGPFVALYLASRGWGSTDIGLVLTVSGLTGLLTQVPPANSSKLARSCHWVAIIGIGDLNRLLSY
jgi:hypothetical protein